MRKTGIGAAVALLAAGAMSVATLSAAPAGASTAQPTLVSTNPADFTPNVNDGRVLAIAQVGNTIVLGGTFSSVTKNGTTFTRNRLLAFDATTGAVSTTFNPNPNGTVEALVPAADGTSVYVGGAFTSVAGQSASRLVRLNVTTGARVAGFASPSIGGGKIRDLKRLGDVLYLSGSFTTVGGQSRGRMASLNATTGALTSKLNLSFSGINNGGTTSVNKFDLTPDGTRLVALGNFTSVAGQSRVQIAMLDTSGAQATVADWSTDRFPTGCAGVFDTYMRDLDFSPNGSYFIVSTTGAYNGPDSLCDSITRWPTDAQGGGQQPYWIDHTGGDTTYAVAATGSAVYAGGHMRWMNNPYAGDAPGAGAVPRQGIVAMDPNTGLPFQWNPGRPRGVGVFDMLATDQGLWVGSDTTKLGGEVRARIAFLPLAGGKAIPDYTVPQLPSQVLQLGRSGNAADPSVLYRVNAGGPELLSADDGPDWAADNSGDSSYRNSGSNSVEAWNQSVTRDSSVPNTDADRAPMGLFDSERWDPGDAPEMQWNFPAAANKQLTVRLYFANQCGCTASVGSRVFNVAIDGSTVLNNFDMVAEKGDRVGFMRSFSITTDADGIDIDFAHGVENPLINGIEIIDPSLVGGGTGASDQVDWTQLSADGSAGVSVTKAGNDTFHSARGAFVVNSSVSPTSTLYTPWADGTLRARTYNSSTQTLGTPRTVDLYNGTFGNDAPNVTGIIYDPMTSRIYYTLASSNRLFWRWFLPESEVVGAVRFDVDPGALPTSEVRGMFLSGGSLYYAVRGSGDLFRVGFDAGVTGAPTLVNDTRDWNAPGMTLVN